MEKKKMEKKRAEGKWTVWCNFPWSFRRWNVKPSAADRYQAAFHLSCFVYQVASKTEQFPNN